MIIDGEEAYRLEEITSKISGKKKPRSRKRDPIEFPLPTGYYSPEEPLGLITHLRLLTKYLIKVKKEFASSKSEIKDGDFISDLLQQTSADIAWKPVHNAFQKCIEFSWLEACLYILRQLHISVTPKELVDSFRNNRQPEGTSALDYVNSMQDLAKGLYGILKAKEALLIVTENLCETRIQLPVLEKIHCKEITSFTDLFNWVVQFHERHIGPL